MLMLFNLLDMISIYNYVLIENQMNQSNPIQTELHKIETYFLKKQFKLNIMLFLIFESND